MPNEKIIEFDLNFIPQGVPPIVHVHQYDVGTIVTLKPTLYYGKDIYDGIDLSACTTIVAYARPDGTKQSYTIYPTVDQNVISFPLDNQMTAVWGPNVMSVGFQFQNHQDILWTQNFILSLEKHPIQAEDYVGTNAFDGMVQTLQQYVDTAYAATPPGYEEHIAKIQAVESAIDDLRDDIRESAEEANEYVDNKISGLDSIYQTLEDAQRAAEEGRAYAGTLVGDLGTQIISDMSLMYTTKDESNSQIAGLEIYAEQVTEASATELRERLGIEYTETGVDFVEKGALSAEITKRANEIKQELSAEFVTEDAVEGVVSAYADSAITQKANEILLEVHQNYETKEDAEDKLLTAQSYTDSQLSISSNQIRTEVNAYTDENIRNLKIGATNLLRGTNEYKMTDESPTWVPSYNNGGWAKTGTATVSELSDPPGNGFTTQVTMGNTAMLSQNGIDWFVDNKNYAAHMWIKKPISEDATGDQFLWFRNSTTGEKIPMSYTDADNNVISTTTYRIHNPSHEEKAIPGDIAGNFIVDDDDILGLDDGSTTYTVEDEDSEWLELDVFFSNKDWPDLVDVVVGDGQTAFTFAGLKIEEGNKITAWQPNEFDIKNYVNTSITQTNERITLLAEAQAVTDGTVNSMSSDFTVMAGKIDAMVEAGYIEPDGNQGWTSSYTAQLENRIYNSVSSTYATNDRVNAVEAQIVTTDQYTEITSRAISNIKVGGENLLRATDLTKNKTTANNATWALADETHGWYQTSNNYVTLERIDISDPPSNGIKKAWKFTSSGGGTENSMVCQQNVPVTYQQEYVVSCYARLVSGSADLHIASFKGSGMSHTATHPLTNDWAKYKMVFTHDFASQKTNTNIFFGAVVTNGVACEVQICGMKLELGNVDTDWCPSVYDMEAYTQASLKVATDSITGTVSALDGRVSTVEQKADNITLKVSNMQVGGTNLIPNSTFEENSTKHTVYGTWSFGTIAGKKCIYCDGAMGNTKYVTFTPTYVPKNGDVYTFSADIYLSNGVKGTTNPYVALYRSGERIDGAWRQATILSGTEDLFEYNNAGWVRAHISFKYEDDYLTSTTLAFSIYARDFTGRFAFRNVKFEKGSLPTEWSPAPEDMQEAMDGNDVITLINLSSTTATIQAKHIDLNGAVTFSSLDTDAQNKINTAQSTADTANSNAATAQSTANSALTKANAADTTLTNWCYNNNKTYIDGSNLYTGTVNASALNLYGELTIKKSKTGTTGGYMGYETGNNGVDDTNGMIIRDSSGEKSYDYYALKKTYKSYIHLSDSGIILRSPYIQLRQSGTQAVKIINDNGLNLKEYNSARASHGNLAITAQSYASDSDRANLHINAATLTLNFSDGCWFEPLTSGNDFFLQPGNTKGQIGSYTENSSGSYTKDRWWSIIWCKSTRFSSIYSEDTTVHSLSDRRQKHDIVYEVPDDVIDKLKPAHFILNNDDEQKVQYGFIAQDVQEVFPGAVGELEMGSNKWLTLSYTYFIPLLVDKCQKLQKQIDNLEEALSSK